MSQSHVKTSPLPTNGKPHGTNPYMGLTLMTLPIRCDLSVLSLCEVVQKKNSKLVVVSKTITDLIIFIQIQIIFNKDITILIITISLHLKDFYNVSLRTETHVSCIIKISGL